MSSQQLLRSLRSRASQIRCYAAPPKPLRSSRPPPPVRPHKERLAPQPAQTRPPQQPNSRASLASDESASRQTQDSTAAPFPYQQPPQPRRDLAYDPNSNYTQSYARALLGNEKSLLLYRAPRHNALFASSAIFGTSLFYWAGTVANGVFLNYTVPWWGKLVVLGGCLVSSAMASSISATPWNLIKTISLTRNADNQVVFRVQGTRFVPFLQPKTFDLLPGEPIVDKTVAMSLEAAGSWNNVYPQSGQAWTRGELSSEVQGGNLAQKLNRKLVNIMPSTKKQVKKMFNREGMAYIRIGGTNWKMDLEECEILDHGMPITKLTKQGKIRADLLSMLTRSIA